MKEIKTGIKESITAFAQGGLTERSLALFNMKVTVTRANSHPGGDGQAG